MTLQHPLAPPALEDAEVAASATDCCPTTPTAATAPPPQPPSSERFEQLLREISAEFQALRQQNASLASENSELRAASSGEITSIASVSASPCSVKSGAAKKSSKVCSVDTEQSSRPSYALATLPEGTPVFRASKRTTQQSQPDVPSSSCPQELFKRLDSEGAGKLRVEELVHIMQLAGEFVDYRGLLDIVRVFNNLDPLCIQGGDGSGLPSMQDELKNSEAMSIDVHAFARLMDNSLSHAHLGANLDACIGSLRRACLRVAKQPKAAASFMRPMPSKYHNDDRYTFWLETIPTIVIVSNTVVAGLTADHPRHQTVWDVCEIIFAAFYSLEFVVKISLYGCAGYWSGPQWAWNAFDFACLVVSFSDVSAKVAVALNSGDGEGPNLRTLMMVKIFRLARLARLVRALRFKFFYELKLMVMGVFSGLRVLTWAIVLLVLLTYLVGIAFTNLLGDEEPEFSNVAASMFTLFRCWTEGCAAYDGTPLAERVRRHHGPFFMVAHVLITMFVIVGVFNLIMAIFIDNVMTSQNIRRHQEMAERTNEVEMRFKRILIGFIKNDNICAQESMTKQQNFLQRATRHVSNFGGWRPRKKGMAWRMVNTDWERLVHRDTTVTREVFNSWLEDGDFQILLNDAEIETSNKFELFDVLDGDMSGELSMDELKTGLMKLRGPVTKADIVAVRLKVRNLTRMLEKAAEATQEGANMEGTGTSQWAECSLGAASKVSRDKMSERDTPMMQEW